MKDWKTIWKKFAQDKKVTSYDVIKYCILKAISAKSNIDKTNLVAYFLEKAFTPIRKKSKLANGRRPWDCLHYKFSDWHKPIKENFIIFDVKGDEIFDTDEEFNQFIEIWNATSETSELVGRRYVYFFIDKTLSPVQYAVQAAHVAYVLGQKHKQENPEQVHFILMETNDIHQSRAFLKMNNIPFEQFIEPDFGNKLTAIASVALDVRYKSLFSEFPLLTVS